METNILRKEEEIKTNEKYPGIRTSGAEKSRRLLCGFILRLFSQMISVAKTIGKSEIVSKNRHGRKRALARVYRLAWGCCVPRFQCFLHKHIIFCFVSIWCHDMFLGKFFFFNFFVTILLVKNIFCSWFLKDFRLFIWTL